MNRRTDMTRAGTDEAVVIVTGGGRGIGAATAGEFARQGARVWIGDLDDDVAAVSAAGLPGARWAHLDVTDADSWTSFVGRVLDEEGRIDVLVNNAGVMPVGPFVEQDDATLDLTLDVNVRGVLLGMRAVLPAMSSAGRGHVVNVASMAGRIPLPGMVSYNASKFGALGASLAARREYDGTGITVSAILPSAVRTELSSGAQLGGSLPTVDPQHVAHAVVRTVRTRAAVTSVPRWVLPGWDVLAAFVPEFVERWARRISDDRRALRLDAEQRRGYSDRVQRHAAAHSDVRGRPVR